MADIARLNVKVGYDGQEAERGLDGLGGKVDRAGGFFKNAAASFTGFMAAGVALPRIARPNPAARCRISRS